MENRKIRKMNKTLLNVIYGVLALAAIGGGACAVKYLAAEDRRIQEEYAALPVTNVCPEPGEGMSGLTAKFVDTDKFYKDLRDAQFPIDNSNAVNIAKGIIYSTVPYKVRVDEKYMAQKAEKARQAKRSN